MNRSYWRSMMDQALRARGVKPTSEMKDRIERAVWGALLPPGNSSHPYDRGLEQRERDALAAEVRGAGGVCPACGR